MSNTPTTARRTSPGRVVPSNVSESFLYELSQQVKGGQKKWDVKFIEPENPKEKSKESELVSKKVEIGGKLQDIRRHRPRRPKRTAPTKRTPIKNRETVIGLKGKAPEGPQKGQDKAHEIEEAQPNRWRFPCTII